MQKHDRVELYELEALRTYSNTTNCKWNGSSGTLSAHESHKVVLAQHPTSMLLGTIRLGEQSSSSSPLRASLLSPYGRFLAISNATSTYVFHVTYNNDESADAGLEPRKLELPEKVATVSATTFLFVGSTLYVGDSSSSSGDGRQKVHVVRLRPGQQQNNNNNNNSGGVQFNWQQLQHQAAKRPPVLSPPPAATASNRPAPVAIKGGSDFRFIKLQIANAVSIILIPPSAAAAFF